jgi:hypothetical protein
VKEGLSKWIGLFLLLAIVAAGVGYRYYSGMIGESLALKGFVGGEKVNFLEDPEVRSFLRQKYRITLEYSKAGSIEMVRDEKGTSDFIWPSSEVALEIYKARKNMPLVKSQVIFNTPIVLYSWDFIVKALLENGFVKKNGETLLVTDLSRLIQMILTGKRWSDIGVNQLYGKISIISTDPTRSNSGYVFAGLLANVLVGDVAEDTSIAKVLPTLRSFFNRLGYLESSSGDLFDQYLRMGAGSKPIVVGYENQLVEFSLMNQKQWETVNSKVAILYPAPTVWSSHPLIAISSNGKKLIEALLDPKLQKIAWEKHGFRTGMIGVQNDPKVLEIAGIPESISQVIPLPGMTVMTAIGEALQTH